MQAVSADVGRAAAGAGQLAERLAGVFYVSPRARYTFTHAQATGHAESPFHAVWFCGGFACEADRRRAMRAMRALRKGATARLEIFRSGGMLQRRGYFKAGALAKRAGLR